MVRRDGGWVTVRHDGGWVVALRGHEDMVRSDEDMVCSEHRL